MTASRPTLVAPTTDSVQPPDDKPDQQKKAAFVELAARVWGDAAEAAKAPTAKPRVLRAQRGHRVNP
jgi:hypothetical protein